MKGERLSAWRRVWLITACVRNEFPTRRPSRGESGVWMGGIPSPKRWRRMEERGIHAAISLTSEMGPPGWMRSTPDLHWIAVPDHHAPTVAQLREACTLIDAAVARGVECFVFCGAGRGRAPTVYVAWLIWRGTALADALGRTRKVRPAMKPTAEQLAALAEWSTITSGEAGQGEAGRGKRER